MRESIRRTAGATFICQQYRAEGRAGVGGLFLYTNTLTALQIGSPGVWFSPFLLGQAKFLGGRMIAV